MRGIAKRCAVIILMVSVVLTLATCMVSCSSTSAFGTMNGYRYNPVTGRYEIAECYHSECNTGYCIYKTRLYKEVIKSLDNEN